jgi:hypothetical protein
MYVHLLNSCLPRPLIDWCDKAQVTIDILPDVALLAIFDFYMDEEQIEVWHTLVHVCQNWRNLVFESPRRLNLRLHCKASTPVGDMPDIWPLLPIVVSASGLQTLEMGNIIAALKHNDRIHQFELSCDVQSSQLEQVLDAMRRPFPALTRLQLQPFVGSVPIIFGSFLGGSAPSLRTLILGCNPFRELPSLIMSATLLVQLHVFGMWFISPEEMVTVLSVLTRLESLTVRFGFAQSLPVRNSLNPQTRTLLPVLNELHVEGVNEYLEDFVARIDTPLLYTLKITFYCADDRLIIDTLQLTQFISRTPRFKTHDEAHLLFSDRGVWVTLLQTFDGGLQLGISRRRPSNGQLPSLAQVWSSSFPQALPAVERLYVREVERPMKWCSRLLVEHSQWSDLFRPFTSVKGLYISRKIGWQIERALQELIWEGGSEALPALESIFLEGSTDTLGPAQEAIARFVAARELAGHPVVVSCWDGKQFGD